MIRIGYACINTGLPSAARTCRLKNARPERLLQISRENLLALEDILHWNIAQRIFLFRISSGTIPFGSHPLNTVAWQTILAPELDRLGSIVRRSGMRISMHPGQYTVLNSPREEVVRNAVAELRYHAALLDGMGLEADHKIVVHLGGTYGDKEKSLDRFLRVCVALPPAVRKRLALENDEKNYSAFEVLHVARRLRIPMVFDVFHHRCLPSFEGLSLAEIIETVAGSWRKKDGRPKIHYSDQHPAKPQGAHSDSVDTARFRLFWRRIRRLDLDIMLEVKDKERSVLNVYREIPQLRPPQSRIFPEDPNASIKKKAAAKRNSGPDASQGTQQDSCRAPAAGRPG